MNKSPVSRQTIYFLSFVGPDYSRSSTLLNFTSKEFEKKYIQADSSIIKMAIMFFMNRNKFNCKSVIVIMSPCHKITICARLFTKSKIILDAGWPLTDGLISRGLSIKSKIRFPILYLVDLTSFYAAHQILVESTSQKHRLTKNFKINCKKVQVSLTGISEARFEKKVYSSENISRVMRFLDKRGASPVLLFRGKLNRESGIETILSTAKYFQPDCSFIFLFGRNDYLTINEQNCLSIYGASDSEMAKIYSMSDIVLGQLSNHPRLNFTIPHKAFEASFFGKCYITTKSSGILEIMDERSACLIENPTSESLSAAIESMKKIDKRLELSRNLKQRYQDEYCQEKINSRFAELVKFLNSRD